MGPIQSQTTNFTKGELSPKIEANVELAAYYKGARTIKNALVAPQGGVFKRYGMEQGAVLNTTDGNSYINSSHADFRLIEWRASSENFLVVLTNHGTIYVYLDGVLKQTHSNTQFRGNRINQVQYASAGSVLFLVHPDVYPHKITRDSSEDTYDLSEVSFEEIPQYDFGTTITDTVGYVSHRLYFNDMTDGDSFTLALSEGSVALTNLVDSSGDLSDTTHWGKKYFTITANQETATNGEESLEKCQCTKANNNFLRQYISVEAETDYVASWDLFAPEFNNTTDDYHIGYRIYDNSNGSNILVGTQDWEEDTLTRNEYSFTTPSGCTEIIVYVLYNIYGLYDDGDGDETCTMTAYVGNVQLEAGSTATDYEERTAGLGCFEEFTYDLSDAGIYGGGVDASALVSDLTTAYGDYFTIEPVYENHSKAGMEYQLLDYIEFTQDEDSDDDVVFVYEYGTDSDGYLYINTIYTEEDDDDSDEEDVWSELSWISCYSHTA